MGLFGSSKSSSVAAPPKKPAPDVVRMMTLRSTKEEEAIANLLREQQAQQMSALEQERRAVNEVAERERQMLAHIATMQTQLAEQQEEVDRARKAEEDLHKALRLAAERLSGVTSSEQGLRSELDKTRQQLADASIEIQHLRARLFGEKGVRLEPLRAGADLQPSAPALRGGGGGGGFGGFGGGGGGSGAVQKDDEVISQLVSGAVPGAKNDVPNVTEERGSSGRQAREQLKRLLHFVRRQLGEDLEAYSKGGDDGTTTDLIDQIGKQRALAAKLEDALHELMGGPGGGGGRGAAGGGEDGVGFAMRVTGDSLPRNVAINDSSIRPILLASGPAVKWVVKALDAPAATPGTLARRAAERGGGGDDEEYLDWVAGETLMLVVEARDEMGNLDADYDAVVLIECDAAHVQGKGLTRVTKGRGYVPLLTPKAGEAVVQLQDGGFSAMEAPAPLRVNFRGGPPAKIAFAPEQPEAVAGDGVGVVVEVRDRFDNISAEVNCEVVLEATHNATWGDEPIRLENGAASLTLVSEEAGEVILSCVEVSGVPEISEHGLSNVGTIQFTPGTAACVQLSTLPVGAAPRVAGERTKLLITVADKYGNAVGESNLAADLLVVAGGVGNATVERGGSCMMADGKGEVWVTTETAREPTKFYLAPSSGAGETIGGLAIRHTEEEPFEAMWTANEIAQFGLYRPSSEPVRIAEERMVIGVRTEDAFGNPRPGFDGRVLVISHARHVRFSQGHGKVVLKDGEGRLEVESDVTEPFQLSLQDIARTGLRTASVLRTNFRALRGVRAIFGDVGPSATQRVGFPYPLPLLVLDRLGNVADDYEGDVPVTMSGAARVAGRAPQIFRIVGGRATLPVLTTIARRCVHPHGGRGGDRRRDGAANPQLQHLPKTTINFVPADATRLTLARDVEQHAARGSASADAGGRRRRRRGSSAAGGRRRARARAAGGGLRRPRHRR